MAKTRVLFLCSANTARSQMAEAFLRKHGGDRFEVHSAGLEPGEDIHPLVRRAMAEVGLNLVGQQPKSLRPYLGRSKLDYVIFVCEKVEENCPILWPSTLTGLKWPFEDPARAIGDEEEKLEQFRNIRDRIEQRIRQWLEELS